MTTTILHHPFLRPSRPSIGNFVLAFRIKTDPDGDLLDASKCRKSRLTFADRRSPGSQKP
jgi:hypothetical protein